MLLEKQRHHVAISYKNNENTERLLTSQCRGYYDVLEGK